MPGHVCKACNRTPRIIIKRDSERPIRSDSTQLKKMTASRDTVFCDEILWRHLWHENENMAMSEDQEASFIEYGLKSRVYIMSTRNHTAMTLKKRKAVEEIAKKLELTVPIRWTSTSLRSQYALTHEPNYYSPAYIKWHSVGSLQYCFAGRASVVVLLVVVCNTPRRNVTHQGQHAAGQ